MWSQVQILSPRLDYQGVTRSKIVAPFLFAYNLHINRIILYRKDGIALKANERLNWKHPHSIYSNYLRTHKKGKYPHPTNEITTKGKELKEEMIE